MKASTIVNRLKLRMQILLPDYFLTHQSFPLDSLPPNVSGSDTVGQLRLPFLPLSYETRIPLITLAWVMARVVRVICTGNGMNSRLLATRCKI